MASSLITSKTIPVSYYSVAPCKYLFQAEILDREEKKEIKNYGTCCGSMKLRGGNGWHTEHQYVEVGVTAVGLAGIFQREQKRERKTGQVPEEYQQ